MVLDVNDAEEDRVVGVGYALASSAEGDAKKRRSMVELDAIHLGADDLGQAVVRRRSGVERAERESWDPLVDLLRDERDVEVELR
jgi:hypothetical protein